MDVKSRYLGVKKSKTFGRILKRFNLGQSKVLDIGCGHGEYLVNFGQGSLGLSSTLSEVEYGRSHNLLMVAGNAEMIDNVINREEKFDCLWANNLFEHLLSPHAFLIKLRKFTAGNSRLIIGVPVLPRCLFLMRFKKFQGVLASNHINFFNTTTLALTVKRAGWIIEEERPFLFQSKFFDRLAKYFTPHIFIICHKDLNFSYPTKKISEWEDQTYYQDLISMSKN